jgi:hypothetical protein
MTINIAVILGIVLLLEFWKLDLLASSQIREGMVPAQFDLFTGSSGPTGRNISSLMSL